MYPRAAGVLRSAASTELNMAILDPMLPPSPPRPTQPHSSRSFVPDPSDPTFTMVRLIEPDPVDHR